MSRSGYSEDCDNLNLYRANVDRTIAGKRGQAFLAEMAAALDAMPVKTLAADVFVEPDGEACAMGVVAIARGQLQEAADQDTDLEDPRTASEFLRISQMLAAEIAYQNDEANWQTETDEQRWVRMRKWVSENLKSERIAAFLGEPPPRPPKEPQTP